MARANETNHVLEVNERVVDGDDVNVTVLDGVSNGQYWLDKVGGMLCTHATKED